MAQVDEVIPITEFAQRTGKTVRQVRRLYSLHAGLKHKVVGEKSSRVNYSEWQRICASPRGYIKLVR